MKLRNVQVCLGCEECFVGDYCTKCGDHHYFYIRAYFEPLFKFGGSHETVSIRNHGVSEKLPDIQTDPRDDAADDHSYPDHGNVPESIPQTPHTFTISQRTIDEAGFVAKFGGLDYTRRVLGQAISRLASICRGFDASPSSNMGTSMDKKRIDEPGDEYIGRDENIKGLYEREQNT